MNFEALITLVNDTVNQIYLNMITLTVVEGKTHAFMAAFVAVLSFCFALEFHHHHKIAREKDEKYDDHFMVLTVIFVLASVIAFLFMMSFIPQIVAPEGYAIEKVFELLKFK